MQPNVPQLDCAALAPCYVQLLQVQRIGVDHREVGERIAEQALLDVGRDEECHVLRGCYRRHLEIKAAMCVVGGARCLRDCGQANL